MKHLGGWVLVAALSGCGGGTLSEQIDHILNPAPPPAPKAVEEVIETAVEATHISTIALAALDGTGSCAALVSGCLNTGCDFALEIDVMGCPVPISDGDGTGVVVVTGTRTGPDSAVLTANFGNFDLGIDDGTWFVLEIASMAAERHGDRVNVLYAQQSVTVRSDALASSAELSQHVWTSDAYLNGTPADTNDDHYTISGGVQETEAGSTGAYVTQAGLAFVEVTPACRRNPTRGDAVIERVGVGTSVVLSMVHVGFHEECDGRADILSALGTDVFSLGGTVEMDLLE